MNSTLTLIAGAVFVGIGATLLLDMWSLLLKRVFNLSSLNFCLVGRWFGLMLTGALKHDAIARAPRVAGECLIGWCMHYVIGVVFAVILINPTSDWLMQPSLSTALLTGVCTVLVPFLIMQPCLGMGLAAAKTPKPMQARLKSLMNHACFGMGLYLSAMLFNWLFL